MSWRIKSLMKLLALLLALAMLGTACGDDGSSDHEESSEATDETTAEQAEGDDSTPAAAEVEQADASAAKFTTLQMAATEEQPLLEAIGKGAGSAGLDITFGEEGPVLTQLLAGSGGVDVLGALHGQFPPLAAEAKLTNLADVIEDLSADRVFAPSMVEAGLLGSEDNLAFVPWAQATYVMAANSAALKYLPEGADIDSLSWDELAAWCKAMQDGEGKPLCGLPRAGLFHRFLEGYAFPSFTGGMVTKFRSAAAADMMTFLRDDLAPTLHPEGINWDFMDEPLLREDVWVAFDHVARLIGAFDAEPDKFIAFPTPAGPAGRGFMPVIVGLGIPSDAENPQAGVAVIEYLTRPDVQAQVLADLAFFPVVDGVDTSDLPAGVQIEAEAVNKLLNSADGIAALLPVGLGDRGGEINQIYRNAYDRIVDGGEDIATVLNEEGDALQALLDETGAPCWDPDPASDGPCVVEAAE